MVGFDEISWLRGNSPAWRLLRAENAPLVLSFLDQVFVAENIRSISAAELANLTRVVQAEGGRNDIYGDLLWALVNSTEFITNH